MSWISRDIRFLAQLLEFWGGELRMLPMSIQYQQSSEEAIQRCISAEVFTQMNLAANRLA